MRTITSDSGSSGSGKPDGAAHGTPSFRPGEGAPGTLTAVPHADQSRNTQQDAAVKQPGAPRPDRPHPTPLGELAARLGVKSPGSGEVTGITHDSRAVRPGDVYAALPGARFHGADFAAQAADLGAAAILTDPAGAERAAGDRPAGPRHRQAPRPDGRARHRDLRTPR